MALREDLHRLLDELPDDSLDSAAEFLEFLRSKYRGAGARTGPDEGHAWLDSVTSSLAERLATVNANIPTDELSAWLAKASEAAMPSRSND